ncbi:TadE/TadG family type IV pilus assembly protein [Kineosporia succinea]|uniref:Flp pilus assembly protein TadG n=1 Tax=Kineosporia succinea TaxID=84632 RepID=A0ABT9P6D2_9ACTN|nr:TadE/TadG family type IV pilus assembly protein [Kineosporia succinea]MDP9828253.1 Flp pilus assembly protein TadG [Kineosporia succinea]
MRLARPPKAERGAVAVEFALVLPLLMLFLFGVIQYGYGLFQLQSFSAALNEASRRASTGVADCPGFEGLVQQTVSANGLSPDDVAGARLEWLTQNNSVTTVPERVLGQVRITATYKPFDIGIPLIPFPDTITRSSTSTVQSVLNADLASCGG